MVHLKPYLLLVFLILLVCLVILRARLKRYSVILVKLQCFSKIVDCVGPATVSAASVRGWSLLLSTVPTHRLTSSSIESSLQVPHQSHKSDWFFGFFFVLLSFWKKLHWIREGKPCICETVPSGAGLSVVLITSLRSALCRTCCKSSEPASSKHACLWDSPSRRHSLPQALAAFKRVCTTSLGLLCTGSLSAFNLCIDSFYKSLQLVF